MATVQYIEEDGRRTFAIVPMTLWRRAIAALGDSGEAAAALAIAAGGFDMPGNVRVRAEECGSAVLAWREYRGFSQTQLAKAASISKAYLSQIETGARHGSVKSLKAIAVALNVPLDALTQ
jgi:DNA-binding XRE family transcriptional regulator